MFLVAQKALEVGTLLKHEYGVYILEVQTKSGLYWARLWKNPQTGKTYITPDLNGEMIERCEPGGIMIDVGANVGRYTIPMATKAKIVYAIEPASKNFIELKENTGHLDNVNLYQIALSDYQGHTFLDDNMQRGLIKVGSGAGEKVATSTLDTLFFGMNDIRAIKIDVEGHEYQVLSGAVKTLMKHHPLVSLETHDGIPCDKIYSLLQNCGYQIIGNAGNMADSIKENEQYLLVPKEIDFQ